MNSALRFFGCRDWADFAAMLACYAIVFALFALLEHAMRARA